MARILVVFHSQTGNTEKMARAFAEGVLSIENSHCVLKKAFDADVRDLINADGIAIGTPENFGYSRGQSKIFLTVHFILHAIRYSENHTWYSSAPAMTGPGFEFYRKDRFEL